MSSVRSVTHRQLTLIVGLDVGARVAVLLMLARAHALQRPTLRLAPGARWMLFGLAATLLLPLLMGCRSASDRVPPAAPVRIVVPDDSNVAWLQRHVLNLILLTLGRQSFDTAFSASLFLSPVGEFSFVIAGAGLLAGSLSPEGHKLAIAVIAMSLLASPIFFFLARLAHRFFFRRGMEMTRAAASFNAAGADI